MFVGGSGFVGFHVFEFAVGLLFMIWRWVLGLLVLLMFAI